MNPADPIIACATGTAMAPRALLRLSGPDLVPTLAPRLATPAPIARGISRAQIRLDQRILPALLLWYPGPRSATGQDVAELLIPGNPTLAHRVIDAFLTGIHPARLALPGEFTARAFLASRLTAEQAEGVQALISSRTAAEHDAARALLSGATGSAYRALADDLASALALVEAGIDFTDQDDVVAITPADLAARIDALRTAIAERLGDDTIDRARAAPIRIVLAGPPNAGKSTLFNRLLGRDRALVAPHAGTTRDAIAEPITARALAGTAAATWHDLPMELVDLAGLDAALDARSRADSAAQATARAAIASADVILWCDPSGAFAEPLPAPPHGAILRIRTKADLPRSGATDLRAISPSDPLPIAHCPLPPLPICAIDGWNIAALGRAILDAAAAAAQRDSTSAPAALLPRHHAALAAAHESLGAARAELAHHAGASPETTAAHLRAALDHLGAICGRIDPDDVIGRIFATFCIGK